MGDYNSRIQQLKGFSNLNRNYFHGQADQNDRVRNYQSIFAPESLFNTESVLKRLSNPPHLYGDTTDLEEPANKYNYFETSFILKPITFTEQIADRPWVSEIKHVEISNEKCKCFTIFLLESEPSFYGIINLMNTAIGSRKRKAIRLINEELIKKTALDHCFNSGERTPFAILCEAVKRAGGENFEGKIPTDLLTYMIKYRMLQEREHYSELKVLEDKLKYKTRLRYIWLDQKYKAKAKGALIDDNEGLFVQGPTKTKFVGSRKEFELSRMKRKLKKVLKKFSKVKKRYDKKKAKYRLKKTFSIQWKSYKRLWKAYRRYIQKCNAICRKLTTEVRKARKSKVKKKEKFKKDKKKVQNKEQKAKLPNVDIMEDEKLDTFLCRHGDLGRDLYAIDDSPLNGPQIYFILSSFRQPDLPELLQQINVPINGYTFIGHVFAIPELFCKETLRKDTFNDDVYISYMKEFGDHFSLITACIISFQSEKKKLDATDVFDTIKEELDEFYRRFFKNLNDHKTYKHYENSIIKDFVPDLTKINFNSKSWLRELIYQLYSDISELAYHYYLVSQVYEKYLKKVQCQDLTDHNSFSAIDLQLYNLLLDKIPNEIIGVPLILDTVITQVCYNEGSYGGYLFENYLEQPEHEGEDLIHRKRGNYFCGYVLPDEESTKCLLFNDQIQIVAADCDNLGEFAKARSNYILSLYFKHFWYSNKTKLSDLEKIDYDHHYQLLLEAVNTLQIRDSQTFLDTLLSILSLEVKSDQEHRNLKCMANILTESSSLKATRIDTDVEEVGYDFNSLMTALIKLEQKLKQNVHQVNSVSSSEVEEYLVKNKFLNEIISKLVEGKIFESLIQVTHFEELPKHVSLQVLWEAFDENNTIKKQYIPLIKKMMYLCYNETQTVLNEALLPTLMSLRDFARYGSIELKDWYNANYKEVIQDKINETFSTTEFFQLKSKVNNGKLKSNILSNQCLTLNECHLMLPLKYRLLLQDLQDTWSPYEFKSCKEFRPTQSTESSNSEQKLDLPLYNFGDVYRTTLFTKTREYVLCDSSIVSFKTYGQLYAKPKLLIQIRQNFHNFTYHTPLYVNKESASILCSHFKGIKLLFYEISFENEDLLSENTLSSDSELNINCDRDEDVNINKSEIEGETEDVKQPVKDPLPTVDDPLGNIAAKFECKLSLPNGLYLENIYSQEGMHYVKQRYLTKDFSVNRFLEEEICRLYLNEGTVIKLSKNNVTEIYYACGRCVRIPKIEDVGEGEEEVEHEAARAPKKPPQARIAGKKKKKIPVQVPLEPYQILEPDGKLYEFVNDQKLLITQLLVSEHISTFRDARKVCIEGGPLINISGNNIQSVTFLDGTRIISQVHIAEEEIFCDWSISELKLWFKNLNEEEEEEESDVLDDVRTEKIDLLEDGFLWVSVSHMIEHPDFVTLVTYPFKPHQMEFKLPNNIILVRYGNGCFDLEMDDNTILLLRHNQIVLDKTEDGLLTQRACINFQVFKEINETPQFIFNCRNLSGDWIRADSSGCILYSPADTTNIIKKSLTDREVQLYKQSSTPPSLKNKTRRLVVDKTCAAYELMLTANVTDFQEASNNCANCAVMKSFEEDPFVGHIYLLPGISCKRKWKIDYCNIDSRLFKLPSTYGPDWLFPFYITQFETCNEPEIVLVRFLNEFIFKDIYKVLHDIMKEYVRRLLIELGNYKYDEIEERSGSIFGEYDQPLGTYPCSNLTFRQRERPKSRIGKEATRLRRKLRLSGVAKLILESPLLRKVIKRPEPSQNIPVIFNYEYFRNVCGIIYREEFGPYFETQKGVAFYIIDTIITRVLLFSDLKHLKERMTELFEKPMLELTTEDLDTMEIFLNTFYNNIWGPTEPKIDIQQVLQAAKRLGDFFPNMRHALNLNVRHHGKYGLGDLCDYNCKENKEDVKIIKCELNESLENDNQDNVPGGNQIERDRHTDCFRTTDE